MCLKTFDRFCADIEVVSTSRIKAYEYIKYRCIYVVVNTDEDETFNTFFYSLESLLLIKSLKHNACLEKYEVDNYFFN